jgi:hypothetical protein
VFGHFLTIRRVKQKEKAIFSGRDKKSNSEKKILSSQKNFHGVAEILFHPILSRQ